MSSRELANAVVKALGDTKQTISTAESCTGGLVAAAITSISGSSNVFEYGIIAYANSVKNAELGVPNEILEEHGAVSEQVARLLAEGVRKRGNADFGIGVTGIAGPTGGTAKKPVGLVHIAAASEAVTLHKELLLGESCGNNREAIRNAAVEEALQLAMKVITSDLSPGK